jgi:hypothetical protein
MVSISRFCQLSQTQPDDFGTGKVWGQCKTNQKILHWINFHRTCYIKDRTSSGTDSRMPLLPVEAFFALADW